MSMNDPSPARRIERPRRLVLATSNPGKVREIRELLAPALERGWELVTPADLNVRPAPVIEGGRSYLENAVLKATSLAGYTGLPALADDSGIEVDALDGRPGVTSARYGGPSVRSDADRSRRLLHELEGVPPARRTARFVCVVALAAPGNRPVTRQGVVEGRIALEPRGESGFGYDPVFELPDGRTMAEIGDEKQSLSHRAIAVRAMVEVLDGLVGPRDMPVAG